MAIELYSGHLREGMGFNALPLASVAQPLVTLLASDWPLVQGPYCVLPQREHERWLRAEKLWSKKAAEDAATYRAAARLTVATAARSGARTADAAAGGGSRYKGENAVRPQEFGQIDMFGGAK